MAFAVAGHLKVIFLKARVKAKKYVPGVDVKVYLIAKSCIYGHIYIISIYIITYLYLIDIYIYIHDLFA